MSPRARLTHVVRTKSDMTPLPSLFAVDAVLIRVERIPCSVMSGRLAVCSVYWSLGQLVKVLGR